jgi:hypothetical protein
LIDDVLVAGRRADTQRGFLRAALVRLGQASPAIAGKQSAAECAAAPETVALDIEIARTNRPSLRSKSPDPRASEPVCARDISGNACRRHNAPRAVSFDVYHDMICTGCLLLPKRHNEQNKQPRRFVGIAVCL